MNPVRLARRVIRDGTLRMLTRLADESGARLLVVGGHVRDVALGRPPRDSDFVLEGPPGPFLERLARRLGRRVVTFRKRGIVDHRVAWRRRELDFVELGRRTLAAELRRRDYTINAVAVDLHEGRVHDPTGGLDDLRRRRLRATSLRTLRDDPLRALRGVRLASENPDLAVERRTRAWLGTIGARIRESSPERVREELDRILRSSRPSRGLRTADRLGLLSPWIPEIEALRGLNQNRYHHLDAWKHTLAAVAAADRPGMLGRGVVPAGSLPVEDAADLRWALLLHDLGKAETRERGPDGSWRFHNHQYASEKLAVAVLRRLRFSRARTRRVRRLVREHLRISLAPGGLLSPRAMRRIIRDLGNDTRLLVLHSLADKAASRGRGHARTSRDLRRACRELLARYRSEAAALMDPRRLVTGRDVLQATGLSPSPEVGRILAEIRELQLEGTLTTREEALRHLATLETD